MKELVESAKGLVESMKRANRMLDHIYPPVTIGIPTKNRPEELSRLLAALHAQTHTNWNLMIVNDGEGDMLTPEGEFWMGSIAVEKEVYIQEGARINQCYSHNHVLWHPNAYDLILRLDDDLVPDRDFLERLVDTWRAKKKAGIRVGAIGGVYFDQRQPREGNPPVPTVAHFDTTVHRDGTAFAVAQMVDYKDEEVFEAEHLYSACLYSRDAMRSAGGWPLVYSDGVAHREETDGTYRMFLAGFKLYVNPSAKAKHEHGAGGIRSMTPMQHAERRASDEEKWLRRVYRLRGVNYKPRIAVASYHTYGVGGAQRLFYSFVAALQATDGVFERVVPISLGEDKLLDSREEIKERYGVKVVDLGEREDNMPWSMVEFDVVITMGHEPPKSSELPPRRHHIHYNLFPTMAQGLPKTVDRYVSISLYSGEALKLTYRRNPEVIYPYVGYKALEEEIVKKNEIVLVGDIRRGKRILRMVEDFLGMDLPVGTVLNVVTPFLGESDQAEFLQVISKDPRVNLCVDISYDELQMIYRRSKVLWAARGYAVEHKNPAHAYEHFGYTPVEALRQFCVPIAYNAGGYKETTVLRWETLDELEAATKRILEDEKEAKRVLSANLDIATKFSTQRFTDDWVRVITSLNAFAWEPQINEWRRNDRSIEVSEDGLHIACVSDSPYKPTGYGLIAREVYKGLLEQGHKLHVFAIEDGRADLDGLYHRYWPNSDKVDRLDTLFQSFMKSHRFDTALVIRDAYTGSRFMNGVRSINHIVPVVSYISQEGAPAHLDWSRILNQADVALTYSEASATAIADKFRQDIGWAYLGADHANFSRYDHGTRELVRQRLGWDDRFVIMNVSRNVRNKRLPLLLKAVKILKESYGYDDILLALHADMLGKAVFGGHDLQMWVDDLDLKMNVAISPSLDLPFDTDVDEVLSELPFSTFAGRKEWFSKLGMVGFYNAADVYVDVSSAEGFGLPNLEAQACGVPVVSVDDHYVRTEILGDSAILVPPSTTPDEWVTGADLWLVSAAMVAENIDNIRKNPGFADDLALAGLENSRRFKWDNTREKIVKAIESCQKRW